MRKAAVDAAIVEFVSQWPGSSETTASERLLATGRRGIERTIELWFLPWSAELKRPSIPTGNRHGWEAALELLALSYPKDFVDCIIRKPMNATFLSIVATTDDPRSTKILCDQVDSYDWLLRYNAVRSLMRSRRSDGKLCLERALGDENLVVRSRAIEGISRWDPERAKRLYEEQLTEPDLTPLLRTEAESALQDLRLGRPVRHALDPMPEH